MTNPARGLALLLLLLGRAGAADAEPASWTARTDQSRLLVHVTKRGLFSGLAHDHHFSATDWKATAVRGPGTSNLARVEVVVSASSLRDRQEALSEGDRAKVDLRAAGPETLDAARFPEIRFVAEGVDLDLPASAPPGGTLDGELAGTLSLHGRRRPLTVPVHATRTGDGWRITGAARFKQSEFGIEPYSGFGGTVAVHDEVVVEYDLVMGP
jgi:polyisoprenoid-binding protein YceI